VLELRKRVRQLDNTKLKLRKRVRQLNNTKLKLRKHVRQLSSAIAQQRKRVRQLDSGLRQLSLANAKLDRDRELFDGLVDWGILGDRFSEPRSEKSESDSA